MLSTVLDRTLRGRREAATAAAQLPGPARDRTDADALLMDELVRRAEGAERERDRLRDLYGRLRDACWANGLNPDAALAGASASLRREGEHPLHRPRPTPGLGGPP